MYVVMGATGHVGAAVADALLAGGEDVTIVTRRPERAGRWRDKGASVATADVEDVASLKAAFRRGRRAFLLNPPADIAGDTDATERRTIANILAALEDSGLEKVVAASTFGARPGQGIGDLTTLWELEEGLRRQPIPAAINRGAYYMSNWTSMLETVAETGTLPSMFPADMRIPMVAPADLGEAAAARLLTPLDDVGVRYVEGPQRYTPQDVARAMSRTLGRDVVLEVVPRDRWEAVYKGWGFSAEAARAYAKMTAVTLDEDFDQPADVVRGHVSLADFIAAAWVRAAHA
ncbi:NmrA family transcriptional regulator [Ralstonia pickettii]|uniref:NmrA family transcriptional regulator n=1 Tax=Ralstonia pickettii TaxID=329 RepID=A0A2N4TR73_RALPI|nr:NmrA family NAD(P)-binding protein [Ralstonia pickettii]PLC42149.1 NmrA family transcriptional regulator [Ralstonia pickettii]